MNENLRRAHAALSEAAAAKKAEVLRLAQQWSLDPTIQMAPHIKRLAGLILEKAPDLKVTQRALLDWWNEDKEFQSRLKEIFVVQEGRLIQASFDMSFTPKGSVLTRSWLFKSDPEFSERSLDARITHEVVFPQLSFVPGGMKAMSTSTTPPSDTPVLEADFSELPASENSDVG